MKLCFDLDGTLCNNTYGEYEKAIPNTKAIEKINRLFDEGHYIIIFTARYMGKFNGDIKKVYEFGYAKTKKQIDNWNLKYNDLILGKPEFDLVIDDKNFAYNEDWISNNFIE